MSPSEKLAAAAERIEHRLADAATISPTPWVVDEDCFIDDAAHFNVGELATPAEAELTVSAVNAMPALAAWLRVEAAGAHAVSGAALAIADQILGGE